MPQPSLTPINFATQDHERNPALQLRPFRRKPAEKKALAESVISSLSSNFLSLQGLSVAVRLAIRSLVASGDFMAASHLTEAVDAVKIYVCNKRKGAEKKNKPQGMKKGKIIDGIGRDYMHDNIIRDHLAAVEAFQPNVDVSLLACWGKLEELVNAKGQASAPAGAASPLTTTTADASSLSSAASVEEYVAEVLRSAVDQVVKRNGGGGAPVPAPVPPQSPAPAPPSPELLHRQLQSASERFLLHPAGATQYQTPVDARYEAAEKVLLHVASRVGFGAPTSQPAVTAQRLQTFETRLSHVLHHMHMPMKYATMSVPGVTKAEDLMFGLKAISEVIGGDDVAEAASAIPKVNPGRHDLRTGLSFLSTYKLHLVKTLLGGGAASTEDTLGLVKIARKQGNFSVAERILRGVDAKDKRLPGPRYEAACLQYGKGGPGFSDPAIGEMLSMTEDCPDEEDFKFRGYLRVARWLHDSERRRGQLDVASSQPSSKPLILEVKPLASASPDPLITASLENLYARGSYKPEQAQHPLGPTVLSGFKCIMNACHLDPGACKPYLRLGELSFGNWVKLARLTAGFQQGHARAKELGMSDSYGDVTKVYHDLAVRSFCKFLSLRGGTLPGRRGYNTITTLRLLKLVTQRPKKALPTDSKEVQEEVDDEEPDPFSCLSEVPVEHWADVVPQLMSLLGHKDPFARRVAADAIVKVATCGSADIASDIGFRISHGLSEPALAFARDYKVEMLREIKAAMLSSSAVDKALFDDISVLQTDMERLVSPWDELWAHVVRKVGDKLQSALAVLYQDVSKEIKAEIFFNKPGSFAMANLSPSVKRAGSFIIKNKLRAHLLPALRDLIKLAHKTLEPERVKEIQQLTLNHPIWKELPSEVGTVADTETESAFQRDYSADIVALVRWILGADEEEKYDLEKFQANFHQMFHSKLGKRWHHLHTGEKKIRKLPEICARLHALFASPTPPSFRLPSTSCSASGYVKVVAVEPKVEVVESKTCPKKVTFKEANGKVRSYLLKGGEDLRVDERMMQMLKCMNKLLDFDDSTRMRGLDVQTYSILPLSPLSGLIEFVEGPQSLYTLFEQHQARAQEREAVVASVMSRQPQPLMPNLRSMFFKEVGEVMAKRENNEECKKRIWKRKGLAKDVLFEVYKNLKSRMPSNLLSTAMLLSASTPHHFLEKQVRYTRSSAVSAILGWIMGLGDRHPANILVNIHTGDVIHIDYGVIFDAGKTLAIPEVVPFRWTDGVRSGMGIKGGEGEGRKAMEHTLRVAKANKEILLTLLEIFIHDPVCGRGYGLGMKREERKEDGGDVAAEEKGGENVDESEGSRRIAKLERDVDALSNFVLKASMNAGSVGAEHLDAVSGIIDESMLLPDALISSGHETGNKSAFDLHALMNLRGSQENLRIFMEGDAAPMMKYLERRCKITNTAWQSLKHNKPFDAQLPVFKAMKQQWADLFRTAGGVGTGIVGDLSALVDSCLECSAWCSKLVDEYKTERGLHDSNVRSNESAWLKHVKAGLTCIESKVKFDEVTSEATRSFEGRVVMKEELIEKFREKRDECASLVRRCGNMQRHLPVLCKRMGETGKKMEGMFEVVMSIVKERGDIFYIICEVEGGREEKGKGAGFVVGQEQAEEKDDGEEAGELCDMLPDFWATFRAVADSARREKRASESARRIVKCRAVAGPPVASAPPPQQEAKKKGQGYKNKAKNPPSPSQQQQPTQNSRMFSLGAVMEWPKAKVERLLSDPLLLLAGVEEGIKAVGTLDCMKGPCSSEWDAAVAAYRSTLASTSPSEKLFMALRGRSSVSAVKIAARQAYKGEESPGEMLLKDLTTYAEGRRAVVDGLERLLSLVKAKVEELRAEIDKETANLLEEVGGGGGGAGDKEAGKDFFCGRGLAGHWKKGELVPGNSIVKLMAEKLSGGGSKENVQATVHDLLKDATSDDKLSMMFEGWCSWF